jgi:hypothetical protein
MSYLNDYRTTNAWMDDVDLDAWEEYCRAENNRAYARRMAKLHDAHVHAYHYQSDDDIPF